MPTTTPSGEEPETTSAAHPRFDTAHFPRPRHEIDPETLAGIHDGHLEDEDEDDEETGGAFFFRGLFVAIAASAIAYTAVWAAIRWL